MKKGVLICILAAFLSVFPACSAGKPAVPDPESTTAHAVVTIPAEDLPVVYENKSSYRKDGGIVLRVPDEATEVTQLILYKEISQTQFLYHDILFTYRACSLETGRTGSALSGIDEAVNYRQDEVEIPPDFTKTAMEGHILNGQGALLFWEDEEYRYSLAAANCSFEELCAVARTVF